MSNHNVFTPSIGAMLLSVDVSKTAGWVSV